MSTKCVCVCDEHRVRTISCGNLPHSSGADAGIRYSVVCDSRLAVCRDLEMVHLWPSAIAFTMDYRDGYDTALSVQYTLLSIESAMHLARRAPRNLGLQPQDMAPRPPPMKRRDALMAVHDDAFLSLLLGDPWLSALHRRE